MFNLKKSFKIIYLLTIIYLFLFSIFICLYEDKSNVILIVLSFFVLITLEIKKSKNPSRVYIIIKLTFQIVIIYYFLLDFIYSIIHHNSFTGSIRNIVVEFLPFPITVTIIMLNWFIKLCEQKHKVNR